MPSRAEENCPRCGGHGVDVGAPDGRDCSLCEGTGHVEIDIERYCELPDCLDRAVEGFARCLTHWKAVTA